MDLAEFYASLQDGGLFPRGFSQDQVDGINDLLDELTDQKVALEGAAYILAGVYHETGQKMVPVREGFASSDAAARSAVNKLYLQGRIKTNYAAPINGVSFYGRGRIQNTWLANYQKLERRFQKPFVTQPDLLLDSKTDALVTVVGHVEGIWTGKKLADYLSPSGADYYGMRRIVNGTDKAAEIATYAKSFAVALRSAGYGTVTAQDAPLPAPPEGHEAPHPQPVPQAEPSVLATIIKALLSIFGGAK